MKSVDYQGLMPDYSRDDGAPLLHGLLNHPPHHPQGGHLQVLRPRHLRSHRPQRHHHGRGVLHDAFGKERHE